MKFLVGPCTHRINNQDLEIRGLRLEFCLLHYSSNILPLAQPEDSAGAFPSVWSSPSLVTWFAIWLSSVSAWRLPQFWDLQSIPFLVNKVLILPFPSQCPGEITNYVGGSWGLNLGPCVCQASIFFFNHWASFTFLFWVKSSEPCLGLASNSVLQPSLVLSTLWLCLSLLSSKIIDTVYEPLCVSSGLACMLLFSISFFPGTEVSWGWSLACCFHSCTISFWDNSRTSQDADHICK